MMPGRDQPRRDVRKRAWLRPRGLPTACLSTGLSPGLDGHLPTTRPGGASASLSCGSRETATGHTMPEVTFSS